MAVGIFFVAFIGCITTQTSGDRDTETLDGQLVLPRVGEDKAGQQSALPGASSPRQAHWVKQNVFKSVFLLLSELKP